MSKLLSVTENPVYSKVPGAMSSSQPSSSTSHQQELVKAPSIKRKEVTIDVQLPPKKKMSMTIVDKEETNETKNLSNGKLCKVKLIICLVSEQIKNIENRELYPKKYSNYISLANILLTFYKYTCEYKDTHLKYRYTIDTDKKNEWYIVVDTYMFNVFIFSAELQRLVLLQQYKVLKLEEEKLKNE